MQRLKRLRKNKILRDLVSETRLSVNDLIMPYFVIEGKNKKEHIKSMPEIYRFSIDNLIKEIGQINKLGIKAILIFGIPSQKDELGSSAYAKDGIVQKATRAIKKEIQDIVVITDVCLCGYTSHGHCGIVKKSQQSIDHSRQKKGGLWTMDYGLIDNDATLRILAKIALSHAEAGADFVAPSSMMDGQVKVIRETLDENRFGDTGILSYSAKYASNFYGPFREALDSTPQFGDRKTYQMDYRNSNEALREIQEDIQEGADIIMVKPALAYLDIIYRAKEKFNITIAAYNVSGEYSMVSGWLMANSLWQKNTHHKPRATSHQLRKAIVLEILTSIKRAGADLIITYHAREVANWLIANSL